MKGYYNEVRDNSFGLLGGLVSTYSPEKLEKIEDRPFLPRQIITTDLEERVSAFEQILFSAYSQLTNTH